MACAAPSEYMELVSICREGGACRYPALDPLLTHIVVRCQTATRAPSRLSAAAGRQLQVLQGSLPKIKPASLLCFLLPSSLHDASACNASLLHWPVKQLLL